MATKPTPKRVRPSRAKPKPAPPEGGTPSPAKPAKAKKTDTTGTAIQDTRREQTETMLQDGREMVGLKLGSREISAFKPKEAK